ncbi:MAG: hypothetical protein ACTSRP_12990 [Candidatus Helarchaeota archaeon]
MTLQNKNKEETGKHKRYLKIILLIACLFAGIAIGFLIGFITGYAYSVIG